MPRSDYCSPSYWESKSNNPYPIVGEGLADLSDAGSLYVGNDTESSNSPSRAEPDEQPCGSRLSSFHNQVLNFKRRIPRPSSPQRNSSIISRFTCDTCHKSIKTARDLSRHRRSVHKLGPTYRSTCGKIHYRRDNLLKHQRNCNECKAAHAGSSDQNTTFPMTNLRL